MSNRAAAPVYTARLDEAIRRVVLTLATSRGLRVSELADTLGIPLEVLESGLSTNGSTDALTAGEVSAVASYFGIKGGREGLLRYVDDPYQPEEGSHADPSGGAHA